MWYLVNKQGKQVKEGDVVKDFRGKNCTIHGIYPPGTSIGGQSGRVSMSGFLYLPSVINCEFVESLPDETDMKEIPGTVSHRTSMAKEKGYDE